MKKQQVVETQKNSLELVAHSSVRYSSGGRSLSLATHPLSPLFSFSSQLQPGAKGGGGDPPVTSGAHSCSSDPTPRSRRGVRVVQADTRHSPPAL
ncbi:hypothetical protein K440DRAFT_613097 [Wilcoxina mikolae CBS 423.85]|nr:hypothetical protein K440DRAFT_613097 [Wilcoxina mikolae CBS 423.85]